VGIGGYKIRDQHGTHFLTFTIVGWVDVFTREVYMKICIDNFKFYQDKGLIIYAYVIMSNHLHLVASAEKGSRGLSAFVRDLKKNIAKQCLKKMYSKIESRRAWMKMVFAYHAKYNKRNSKYQFWIQNNKPKHIVTTRWMMKYLAYIHLNPVRAGWVDKAEDYVYSSAQNYLDIPNLHPKLKITTVELDIYS